jgi:hypothetical protein
MTATLATTSASRRLTALAALGGRDNQTRETGPWLARQSSSHAK